MQKKPKTITPWFAANIGVALLILSLDSSADKKMLSDGAMFLLGLVIFSSASENIFYGRAVTYPILITESEWPIFFITICCLQVVAGLFLVSGYILSLS